MQSSRDAVEALMRGCQADYVPVHDSPWGDTVAKWVTQGMPVGADGSAVDVVDHFHFDMAPCGGWFDWQAKRGEQEIVEETPEWKIVRNGNGAVLRWWKTHSGTPEHLAFAMDCRAVWERDYRPLLTSFDPGRVDVESARRQLAKRRAEGRWCYFGHMCIWEILRASLGDTGMMMALVEDPEWIHDVNRVYTDLYLAAWRKLLDEAGRPDGIWIYEDLGYRDKLFCSPKTLADLFFPYYTELVALFHEYDLPVVLHSCGYQTPMIPLAVAAGFDALNPMEAKAGNDLFACAEQYGDRLCFVGGFDARILESHDRPLIRREVQRFMRGMKERGARFLFGSDHSLSTNIDYADFCYALEVYREER